MTYLPLAKRWGDVKAKLGDVTEEKILANTKIRDVDPTPVDNVLLKVIDGVLQLRKSDDTDYRYMYPYRVVTTRIVAASNSKSPDEAHYECDGTADESEIELAIGEL